MFQFLLIGIFSIYFNISDKNNTMTADERAVPIFTQKLKDLRCCDGDSVRLVCIIDAQPTPEVFWEKDGKSLDEKIGNICTSFDGEHASLIINRVYPEDEGEYTCVAKNSLGQTSTTACIVVDGNSIYLFFL